MNGAPNLSGHLRDELIISERLRAKILSIMFASASLIFLTITLIFDEDTALIFGEGAEKFQMAGLILFVSFYEFVLHVVIRLRTRGGKGLPEAVRYWNALVEITFPTIGMILLRDNIGPLYTLLSPIVALYFIFIILSILRLQFLLSFFTGVMAALQYMIVAYVFLEENQSGNADHVLATPAIYYARAAMLIGAGTVAGLIARLIRERIGSELQSHTERRDAIHLFGQQVSGPIAEELLRNPQAETGVEREVTVMFLDIRDFTPFADTHRPEEVVRYLNALFSPIIEIVDRHGGIVNQFLGDGIMTTFGAPISSVNHASEAITAAMSILESVHALATTGEIPPTKLGIGLHSGPALTGNIGSDARKQYSVTGTTVILASRIEQENKAQGTSLLFSEKSCELASMDRTKLRSIGPVHLKGTAQPILLFTLPNSFRGSHQ